MYSYCYLGLHVEGKEKTVSFLQLYSYRTSGNSPFLSTLFLLFKQGNRREVLIFCLLLLSGHRPYDIQGFLKVPRLLCMGKGTHLYSGIEWLHNDSHAQQSLNLKKMLYYLRVVYHGEGLVFIMMGKVVYHVILEMNGTVNPNMLCNTDMPTDTWFKKWKDKFFSKLL